MNANLNNNSLLPDSVKSRSKRIPKISTSSELAWLAGLLEGDGTFMAAPPSSHKSDIRIVLVMTDLDVVKKVARLFGSSIQIIKPRKTHHKIAYLTKVDGGLAYAFMCILLPYMGERRKACMELLINNYSINEEKN